LLTLFEEDTFPFGIWIHAGQVVRLSIFRCRTLPPAEILIQRVYIILLVF
jgi:hypothetical protein